jgi:excisionase family DNA binding protein
MLWRTSLNPDTRDADRQMVQPDELITPQEVARSFGVAVKTVTRWAQRGILPSVVTPGGHHRFWRSDVDELLYSKATPRRGDAGGEPDVGAPPAE